MGRPPKHVVSRIMALVVEDSRGCWCYAPHRTPAGGYRQVVVSGSGPNAVIEYAHRVTYRHLAGPIPAGMQIDHLCRNRTCVNPAHLEPVTASENRRRAMAIRTECPQGHPYDEENTGRDRTRRYCKECNRTRARERYRNKVRRAA